LLKGRVEERVLKLFLEKKLDAGSSDINHPLFGKSRTFPRLCGMIRSWNTAKIPLVVTDFDSLRG
jgi:hypothetical protein